MRFFVLMFPFVMLLYLHLNQAIAEDPDDAIQWHQLGLHSLCTQQFKKSQIYLKAAVARMNKCSYAWSNLGIYNTVYIT